jgi:NADPH:quinone reductase-like Zn-dependent oxidoreductase
MKAVQLHGYGGVDQLRYEDVPDPKPGPGEVLVRVAATSVNPIDWKIRAGYLKDRMQLQFPVILGRDVAGEIAEDAGRWTKGQKVLGLANRTYAELVNVPADVLASLPDGLDERQAGALPLVLTTGAQLMEAVRPEAGQTVLVTGALGNVGRTAVYVARQRGARVIAGVLARQKPKALSLGADRIIATDSDDEIQGLPELDAIADTVGEPLVAKLIEKLRPGGTLGSVLGRPKSAEGKQIRVEAILAHPDAMLLHRLADAVRKGELDIPVARTFSLKDAAQAQALAEQGGVDGKIVLLP